MIIAFDIGGSAIKGGLAFSADDIRPLGRIATPKDDFPAFLGEMRRVIEAADERPTCLSLSITGVVDPETQTLISANIPCIHGRRLADDLTEAFGIPALVANDADCFAMSEATLGAGRGHRIVFGIILGTGVGGGIVSDGHLINAAGGFAGEWGHGPIAPAFAGNPSIRIEPFQCGCGQVGCIDTVGGARGLERLHQSLHGLICTSQEIIDAWEGGDEKASRTIDIYIDLVAPALAVSVNITGASIVPVGGGLSNVPRLIERLDRAVRQRILKPYSRPLVVQSECRIEPGLVGAALLGLQYEAEVVHAS